jgi:predicted nucleic acid-binding protein
VAAKWVLAESDSASAHAIVTESLRTGAPLCVLDIALAEVTNAIWKQYHRGLATIDEAREWLDDLLACPVSVQPTQRLLPPALEISAKFHCAVYDALFVALAQDLGLSGVTADEPLYNAVHADHPNIILLRNWQP